MSRSLVLGNGTLLLCFDKYGQLRDCYFPYVGLENHINSGDVHKIGVWADGLFSWISDGSWNIHIDYEKETLVSHMIAENNTLGVRLTFTDAVYNEKNIFIRKVVVQNLGNTTKRIKVFFNQQFQISQTSHADTAYFNPAIHSLVHYKGRRVFLVSAESEGKKFEDYSVGIFKIEGKEGTWRDAEDGKLSQNPIEHGSVDSTLGVELHIEAGQSKILDYSIIIAETFREATAIQASLYTKTSEHVIQTTRDFWHAWVNKFNFSFFGLSEDAVTLFKKSLFIIRTHCDNQGGILASGDSDNFRYGRDTYAYVWPRDGAFVAIALDKAGYFDIAHRFYEFANQVITERGYVLHKYQPDKSFGSSWHPWVMGGKEQLPIQEDETALLLVGLWNHYQKSRDLEFIESIYNSFIKNAAQFMVSYLDKKGTGLPLESYDLWEEKRGISTFTASSVYAGLIAASQFAGILGKRDEEDLYRAEAEKIQKQIVALLYNSSTQYFNKLLDLDKSGNPKDESIDLSSFAGVFRFGVLPVGDEKMLKAKDVAQKSLSELIPVGGYARYQGDLYYEVTRDVPGNPWFITHLWMMQFDIERAQSAEELAVVAEKFSWVVKYALPSGILSEQIHPLTGEQLSVAPLTWSHAEYVTTIIAYLEKAEALGLCSVCYPVK